VWVDIENKRYSSFHLCQRKRISNYVERLYMGVFKKSGLSEWVYI